MKWLGAIAVVLCLQVAGSEDFFWRPNTDWSNPSNWAAGRAPCEGEVANFSAVPSGSVVKLDTDAAVRSLVLPVGSTIVLGRSISLRLSNKTTCTFESTAGPLVAEVKDENNFVGAGPKYWECAQNWETEGQKTAENAPCGKDRAIFQEDHYYSTVESNASVAIQYLEVRGKAITNDQIPSITSEFNLNLTVVQECGEDPSLCPCLSDCEGPTYNPHTDTPKGKQQKDDNSKRTTAIVVVVVVVILGILLLGIVLVFLWVGWRKRNGKTPYMKDDLLGEPEDSMNMARTETSEQRAFDNPIYESEVKKAQDDGGETVDISKETKMQEEQAIALLKPSTDSYEPVDFTASKDVPVEVEPDTSDKKIALNEYEQA